MIYFIKILDEGILKFYSKEHIKSRKIVAKDRSGNMVSYPIISASIAAGLLEKNKYHNEIQVNDALAEVKKQAKAVTGSTYYID